MAIYTKIWFLSNFILLIQSGNLVLFFLRFFAWNLPIVICFGGKWVYIYYSYSHNLPFYIQKCRLTEDIKWLMRKKVEAISCEENVQSISLIEYQLKGKEKALQELITLCPQVRSRQLKLKDRDKIIFLWLIALTIAVIVLGVRIEEIKQDVKELFERVISLEVKMDNLEKLIDDLVQNIGIVSKEIQSVKEELVGVVKKVDTHITDTHRQLNQLYEENLKKSNTIQEFDKAILKFEGYFQKAANYHQPREWFGLGCWPAGTRIQVDSLGNTKNIEDIYDSVWNVDSQSVVLVKRTIAGLETGFLWEISTSDGFAVNVTETHPMKIYVNDMLENVAAKNVGVGNWTVTINGQQKIVNINKIYVENVMVYNLEMYLPQSTPTIFRSVVSNGIHTLDFFAQMQHK